MLSVIQLERFGRLSTLQVSLTENLLIALEDHNKRLSMSAGQVVFSTTTRIRQLDIKLAPWVKFGTQLAWLRRLFISWRFQKLARINVTGIPAEGHIGLAVIPREITATLRETNYQYRLWERTPEVSFDYA
ncbi:hypothetical protein EXIGLDRAFT_723048 [Exidia glandulosa HHB12029]|uniref:Uncharacterized protein n=1 Tax=Exidia glandulosa HHB12029 TaxID=1314781 RepID=A0A165EZ75_EXIGL|nr:hypothetical protein EXIGLDRAFT_723048 [Exidia glandulosa HHB12029]